MRNNKSNQMTPELIEARRQFGRLFSKSKSAAKPDRCLWCGKKISRFCDSHTIPQMVLKNIDSNGKFDYANTILENPLIKYDQGMAEANIFHLLCTDCDNTLFQDYENLSNLKRSPTDRMLAQIALKNLLLILSKRLLEIEFFDLINEQMDPFFIQRKQMFNQLDKRDFFLEFDRIRQMLETDEYNYEIITYDKVNYKVPIAFQGALTVYGDMNGEMVIDIYDDSASKTIKQMHMCVFPLDDCSVIFTFYNKTDSEYVNFARQLKSMNQEKRLKFLGYFMFFISEDMMIAKKFPHRTYFYEQVKKMFREQYEFWTDSKEEYEGVKAQNLSKFKYWKEDSFPGILTQKYAIKDERTKST